MTGLELRDVAVGFGRGQRATRAVDRVTLSVPEGGAVGLVGESGSGKSTLARAVAGLVPLTEGEILHDGVVLRRPGARPAVHPAVQMVFQSPYASLNPRMPIGAAIGEVAARAGTAGGPEVRRLLDLVALPAALAGAYPHQLSGGQRQRVAIARALAARPRVLLLDEVTSALDVSVQAVVLNLLRSLRAELGLSYLVISHDLAVVHYLCEQVYVMYLGGIVEHGTATEVLARPRHPYTEQLAESARSEVDDPFDIGDPPDPRHPPSGCRFHPRCPVGPTADPAREVCRTRRPAVVHGVACHFPPLIAEGASTR